MIFFYGLVGLVVLLDQGSKVFMLQYLSPGVSVSLIPHVADLALVMNPGVAFGLFKNHAPVLFGVITMSLILLFWVANRSHHEASLSVRWALSLILGGAIGNWIDRVRFGAVIDFIDFRIWPVFNLADSAITIGVSIYILSTFCSGKKHEPHSF